jgi:hypothetical protein
MLRVVSTMEKVVIVVNVVDLRPAIKVGAFIVLIVDILLVLY